MNTRRMTPAEQLVFASLSRPMTTHEVWRACYYQYALETIKAALKNLRNWGRIEVSPTAGRQHWRKPQPVFKSVRAAK